MMRSLVLMTLAVTTVTVTSCGDDETTNASPGTPGSAQTPATGASEMEAWLGAKHYAAWHCEPAAHDARSPSPHGRNRICTNDLLSAHAQGEYPVGAAAVKEIDSGGSISGHAVYLHVKAGTTGDTWYWYEKLGGRVVADGTGDSGVAKSVCVGCHQAAGTDAMHSGHDFVYTQVK